MLPARFAGFFADLDRLWPEPIALSLIGSTALMLQTDYDRGTKDSDVLETRELDADIQRRLCDLAGPDTGLFRKQRIYLDIVANGIPFLPHAPIWHPVDAGLERLALRVLDVVDVVVSKLKRFHANDRSDIDAMIGRGLVAHDVLLARFCAAVDELAYDARGPDLPGYIDHLHQVERDSFGVGETEIELPSWL